MNESLAQPERMSPGLAEPYCLAALALPCLPGMFPRSAAAARQYDTLSVALHALGGAGNVERVPAIVALITVAGSTSSMLLFTAA